MRLTAILSLIFHVRGVCCRSTAAGWRGRSRRVSNFAAERKPATSGSAARPSRRRPKATATPVKSTEKTSGTPVGSSATGSTGSTTNTTAVRPVNVPRLGIGLTLFSRDSNGLRCVSIPIACFKKAIACGSCSKPTATVIFTSSIAQTMDRR